MCEIKTINEDVAYVLTEAYHLPHNAIRVDEFEFMLDSINVDKLFYTYNELRLYFLQKEILSGNFSQFHSTIHTKLYQHPNSQLQRLYHKAINGDCKAMEDMLQNNVMYTPRKSFKQVWNEYVRDYTEFFAFLGLLPTYYKGVAGGENRHYVTSLLKNYQLEKTTLLDLLLDFKFRNSSKNYTNLEMYHIEVRPFVVAIKALQFYKRNRESILNPHIISAIVVYSKDEKSSFLNSIRIFENPTANIETYRDKIVGFNDSTKKEIARVTLFLKPYLIKLGLVSIQRNGNADYYHIADKINEIAITDNVAFCNGNIGNYKLTPLIGRVLYLCKKNVEKEVPYNFLFDDNFTATDKSAVVRHLKELGIVSNFDNNYITISGLKSQYALNPFTDFMTYEDACYVADSKYIQLRNEQIVIDDQILKTELEALKQSALSSDGAAYEYSLYAFLSKHIRCFSNLKHYGTSYTGKRVSDIAGTVEIYNNGTKKNILIIMECKAAKAIRAFDERKERDDIINLLKLYKQNNISYDGIWYWVTDSNSLPDSDIHGGYRKNDMSKEFVEKLNSLQFDISEESRLPSIVTAFSIDALIVYLLYLYQHIICGQIITETTVPHFWRWSKKFMNVQYVTIHKKIAL